MSLIWGEKIIDSPSEILKNIEVKRLMNLIGDGIKKYLDQTVFENVYDEIFTESIFRLYEDYLEQNGLSYEIISSSKFERNYMIKPNNVPLNITLKV